MSAAESLAMSVPAPAELSTGSKASIAKGFGGACQTYDTAARLQKRMGDAMLASLPEDLRPGSILDLGCGTGWFTRKLAERFPGAALTGADLSPGMLAQASINGPEQAAWLNADAEQLPLPDQSVDLIFSNLMIQWSNRPEAILAECRRLLKPSGVLAVSTLLDGTLWELENAWAQADPGQPHVNRFVGEADWQALASSVLPGVAHRAETLVLPYNSPLDLNRELKHLGAGYKGEQRRRTVTAPGRFKAMCQSYPKGPTGEVNASYRAGWLYWQKPAS
ncbi:malonyl-ACP O-methyltransferase BioC [Marinobacter nauticus]